MVILGWQLQSPVKVVYVRGRGFGWTWRGWPVRRVRWFGYAYPHRQQPRHLDSD